MNELLLILSILFLPLLGGWLSIFIRRLPLFTLVISLSITTFFFFDWTYEISASWEWISDQINLGIRLDKTSLRLIFLVLLISLLVHVFTIVYEKEANHDKRFYVFLGSFVFSMIGVLLADSFILLFIFWELVGLSSYLLIGFWYKKNHVSTSQFEAFMINRVGDICLLIGILWIVVDVSQQMSAIKEPISLFPAMLIVVGAYGKSAQFPFSTWLVRAMVGPTPVSALVHSATMVTIGVYVLYRLSPYLPYEVMIFIVVVGGLTGIYGTINACIQQNIKKILAYSTISQLGWMMLAVGIRRGDAALFHLWTHAFFKAGLFLCVGLIIRLVSKQLSENNLDIKNMGGLKKFMPVTFWCFIICGSALAGIPLFSGFLSKENIFSALFQGDLYNGTLANLIRIIVFVNIPLTAFYISRMFFLLFIQKKKMIYNFTGFRAEPWIPSIAIMVLGVASFGFWYRWDIFGDIQWSFYEHARIDFDQEPHLISLISIFLTCIGVLVSYGLYVSSRKNNTFLFLSHKFGGLKKYVLYPLLINDPYHVIGKGVVKIASTCYTFDKHVINGMGHSLAIIVVVFSKILYFLEQHIVGNLLHFVFYIGMTLGKILAKFSEKNIQTQISYILFFLIFGIMILILHQVFF